MPTPEELGLDVNGLGDIANTVNRLKLLELLQLKSQGERNSRTNILGEILKMQESRGAALADSYAPGTKYNAGFEPAGVFDAISAFSKELGGRGFEIDPGIRELNPQHLEDMGGSIADALAIMKQITDANGEDNTVQNALMEALMADLMPKAKEGAKPATGALSGKTGDLDMGVGGTAASAGTQSIKPPLGAAGEPKGSSGGGGRRTLSGDAGSVIDAITSGYGQYQDVVNNGLAGITNYLGLTSPKGNSPPKVANTDFNPDATAALVAEIMQRSKGPNPKVAPVAGPNRANWGANKPGSKHPTGYKEGSQVFEGPTMIRVGERSPKDKKYATEEVVFAAPGTVVAPVPKGMENPSEEDAAGLLIAQILKTKKNADAEGDEMHDSQRGSLTTSASSGRNLAMQSALGLTNMRMGNRNQHLDRQLRERQMYINRDQGNRGLDLQDQNQRMNYDLGLRNWQQAGQLGNRRLDIDQELGRGNLDLGRRSLEINFQRNQEEFRNWEAERALKRELGMRGLDIDKQRADQDYQLNSAQMAFQQIMAGITGSALPGVRAGRTPQLSLLG